MKAAMTAALLLVPLIAAACSVSDDPGEHYRRGLALSDDRRWTEALVEFDRAVFLDGSDADARAARGATLVGLGRYSEAREDLDAAIALDPRSSDAYAYRITVNVVLNDLDQAFSDLRRFRGYPNPFRLLEVDPLPLLVAHASLILAPCPSSLKSRRSAATCSP